jgi:hypothetical protein
MSTKHVFQVRTGFWRDHTHSSVTGATLTLPIRHSNYLLASLTLAVTISATCFWIIAAFVLHQLSISRNRIRVNVIDLQHQVILRNSTSPLGTLWDLIKIQLAWRRSSVSKKWRRTWFPLLASFLIWAIFVIASIFVSEVASKSYYNIRTILNPEFCGYWDFDTSTLEGSAYYRALQKKDTLDARGYASNWYSNASSSLVASTVFPSDNLPITTTEAVDCPFDPAYCFKTFPSFSVSSLLLDSHEMFGINAPPKNRVQFQKNVTCANLYLGRQWVVDNGTIYIYAGNSTEGNTTVPYTYIYDGDAGSASLDYFLE